MWQAVNRLLSECLGPAEIRERTELPGGDIHEAWRLSYGEKRFSLSAIPARCCQYLLRSLISSRY